MEIERLTITRKIADDGDILIGYERSDGLTVYDAPAMCAFASHALAADEMQPGDGR